MIDMMHLMLKPFLQNPWDIASHVKDLCDMDLFGKEIGLMTK